MEQIIERYLAGESAKKLSKECGKQFNAFKDYLRSNGIHVRTLSESITLYQHMNKGKFKHTAEAKAIISMKRKKYLADNPDKHVWKRHDKFKSEPCEVVKNKLINMGIRFVSEFSDFGERHFSSDIAFPGNNICIEINGNQHYNTDGTLKPYYQKRHDYIEALGWTVHEIHYSICYNDAVIEKVLNNIVSNCVLYDFDYDAYLISKLHREVYKCLCGNIKTKYGLKCVACAGLDKRRCVRPNKEVLEIEVVELGFRGTGKKYGVSDNAVRKWLKL